jgi:hypothetical protein
MSMSEAGKLGAIASKETQKRLKQERINKYYENPKKCLNCEKPIPYEVKSSNKFCSHSCSATKNNKGVCRTVKYEILDCLNCGNKVNRFNSKYCSQDCHVKHTWEVKKERMIREGKAENVRQARRFLKDKQSGCCAMCGIYEWLGKPIMLLCDHINGNSEDWNLINLRMICSNCDATTPFYKGRNKGNGRYSRKQRYKEGKSF